jgi:hypothetical protein
VVVGHVNRHRIGPNGDEADRSSYTFAKRAHKYAIRISSKSRIMVTLRYRFMLYWGAALQICIFAYVLPSAEKRENSNMKLASWALQWWFDFHRLCSSELWHREV